MIYFDNAATKPIYKEVKQLIIDNLDEFGNASSVYDIGFSAKQKLEESRAKIARLINAEPEEIFFTSGGSEADTQAIKTVLNSKNRNSHAITSSFEHPAVLDVINQCVYEDDNEIYVSYANPDEYGFVHSETVQSCLHSNTKLISVMMVNNEIGTIQPIKDIAKIAHENGTLMHTDAVQAVGQIPIDVKELGVDMLSASGHKFGSPKGIGFLYCKKGINPYKLICGGMQETNARAGTQNVLWAMAMAKALEISCANMERSNEYVNYLRDLIMDNLFDIPNWRINGSMQNRVVGNLNISFDGISGEEIQLLLNDNGIAISTGSACHSGRKAISETLKAIKTPNEYVGGTIRISLSELNTIHEVRDFNRHLKETIEVLKKY